MPLLHAPIRGNSDSLAFTQRSRPTWPASARLLTELVAHLVGATLNLMSAAAQRLPPARGSAAGPPSVLPARVGAGGRRERARAGAQRLWDDDPDAPVPDNVADWAGAKDAYAELLERMEKEERGEA